MTVTADGAVLPLQRGEDGGTGGDDRIAVRVAGTDAGRAVDGDSVCMEVHPRERWAAAAAARVDKDGPGADEAGVAEAVEARAPTGKFVAILWRGGRRETAGSVLLAADGDDAVAPSGSDAALAAARQRLRPKGETSALLFVPVHERMPPVLVTSRDPSALVGMRILARVDAWPTNSPLPLGHPAATLGKTDDKDVETEVLLHEVGVPTAPFSPAVLACLPPEGYTATLSSDPSRTDFRHLPILSIDPPECVDIDDTLHCVELESGNWQVGVHIADVTHYVRAGCALDAYQDRVPRLRSVRGGRVVWWLVVCTRVLSGRRAVALPPVAWGPSISSSRKKKSVVPSQSPR